MGISDKFSSYPFPFFRSNLLPLLFSHIACTVLQQRLLFAHNIWPNYHKSSSKKCYLISRVVSRLSIGLSLRCFAPKCANTFGTLKRLFSPMPDGSWYIWRMRWRHPSMAADYVMGIFDFTNAFNNLHRHDMLLAVIAVSELYSLLFRLQSPIHSVLRFIHHFVGGRVPIRWPSWPPPVL